jgi:6-phosphogluconolactonase
VDAETVYVVTEATSTLQVFHLDRETGKLERTFCCSNLPDGYTNPKGHSSAAIHRSPDGRFLYVSNRGHDSITVYSLEGKEIRKTGYAEGPIQWPREFMITPDGMCVLVGNETAGTFSIFRTDPVSGIPEYTGKTVSIPDGGAGPVCFIISPATWDK